MSFLDALEKDRSEMITFLRKLVSIPSVKGEAEEGAPFGLEILRALKTVLSWGENNGFRTKNLSGYAGHIEFGDGDETIGVLVHLDVVPPGAGWRDHPFSGVIKEERIYGRGTIDDKGPAVAAMFALKALKDEKIELKKKIRIIIGCDEESGWACMDHYFKLESKPEMGFAPDAEFPLINCEKGLFGFDLDGVIHPCNVKGGPRLTQFQGGKRRNVVPDLAEAVVIVDDSREWIEKRAELNRYFGEKAVADDKFEWEEKNGVYYLKTFGVSAHASLPQLGENALISMALILNGLGQSGGIWEIVRFIADKIGWGHNGENLGIECEDEISGVLTLNLGVLNLQEDQAHLELDIRYPLCAGEQGLIEKVSEQASAVNLSIKPAHTLKPHYVPEEGFLVQSLLKAYREETQDFSAPIAIGGRTYAMTLGNGVAFGPGFPGRPELAHQKDEYISLTDFFSCARIYARALFELARD